MRLSPPLEVKNFRRLLASYGLNEMGWGLGTVALAVLVYARTGSVLATTGLFLASTFAPALLAPAITAAVDRLPRSRTLALIYGCEALVFGLLAFVSADIALVAVFGLAMLDGALALTGRALTRASVAAVLAPAGELRAGNALLNIVWSVGSIAGPALGGGVVALAGTSASLAGAAIVFVLMAGLFLRGHGLPCTQGDEQPWGGRLREGMAYIARRRRVRRLVCAQAVLLTVCTLAVPIEVAYAQESLHAGPGAYGLLLAAWGAGMVGGSVLFARAGNRSLNSMNIGALSAVALAYAIMAGAPVLAIAVLGCVLGGIGNGISAVAMLQLLQQEIEPGLQARVMGLWEGIGSASIGVGYVLGGAIAALSSPRAVFAVAAIGAFGVALALRSALPGERAQTSRPAPREPAARAARAPELVEA